MKLPAGMDMQKMMKQAQQMQQRMQEQIAAIRVDATAGGGMVAVKMDGHKNLLGITINPEVAGDVEMLQDLVMAAVSEAIKKVDGESQKAMGALGLPPGLM
jgi:nucleoid-associated protein EbfC